jgi:protein gp37
MAPEWATDIRDQCAKAGVAFFFKQWGGKNKKKSGRVLEGRTWDQMPREPGRRRRSTTVRPSKHPTPLERVT